MKLTLPKVGDLESPGTPESLEFNRKGKNTLPWGVLGVIGKVLKFRCPKWPRIGHLYIFSPSYGQKKGRKSNLQFDSRPLKSQESTRPRCALGECNPALKSSQRGLQVWFRPRPDRRSGREAMMSQSLRSPNRDSFGTPLWESRDKQPLGCGRGGVTQRIL
jgi:hypothetical protein